MNANPKRIVCLIALAALAGCDRVATPTRKENPDPPSPAEVEVARVRSRPLTQVLRLPASVEAEATAPLMSYLQAYVSKVHVDIGDRVEKGQVLLELDAPQLQEQVTRREKVLEQKRAEVRLAEAELVAAESRLEAKRAMVRLRISQKERVSELAEQGMLTEAKRDEAVYGEDSARADLISAENGVAVAAAMLQRAMAQVEVASVQVEEARALTKYLNMEAPFDGVVTDRKVDPGVFVEPASGGTATPLLIVTDTSKLRAVVHLTVEDAPFAKPGSAAKLALNDAPGERVAGALARTSGVFEPETRMMRAEIDVPNPQGALRAGGYGIAEIIVRQQPLPAAPTGAVVRSGDSAFVMVLGPGDVINKTEVEIGIEEEGYVGFESGVAEGDLVVVEGAAQLKDGETIKPKN